MRFLTLILVHFLLHQSFASDYCMSKVCLLDAARLIEFASDDEQLEPCADFREFSLGKLVQYRSMQEEYDKSGFLSDTLAQRLRLIKTLKAPIKNEDAKVHKITKNFFQKCTSENFVQHHGKHEIEEFLKNRSMPLIDGANWDPNKVDISELIQHPTMRLEFFLTHKVARCSDPRDPESLMFCFRYNKVFENFFKTALKNPQKTRADYYNRLKEIKFMIKVDDELVNAAVSNLMKFLEDKIALESEDGKQVPIVLKIKHIKDVLTPNSNLSIDWKLIINQAFLEHSQVVSDEEEILIDDWNIFANSLKLIEKTPSRNIMDVFLLAFLFRYEHIYAVNHASFMHGGKHEKERFDHCFKLLNTVFAPGILSVFSEKYPIKDLNADEFVKEAVDEVLNELTVHESLEVVVKDDLERKFRRMKIKLGIMDEILDVTKMNELYHELNLKGDESLLETTVALVKHNNKLNNEQKSSWFFLTNQLSQLNNLKYIPEVDVLYIPSSFLLYPYYDHERPRFLNTATLFNEIVLSLNEGVIKYLATEFRLHHEFSYDSIQLGFKNYQNFLTHQKDKKLPGFSLSDDQMYWLAFANTYFLRYHTSVATQSKESTNLQFEYFHVWFKARREFRETFKCSEMSEEEKGEYENLHRNFTSIYRI